MNRADGLQRPYDSRQEQVDRVLREINKLADRIQRTRGHTGGLRGADTKLRSLEETMREKWAEVRALRAGASTPPRRGWPGKYS